MSEKHKKLCIALNYFRHFFVSVSTVSGCVSISAFTSLVGISIDVRSSEVGLTFCAITAGTKKDRSIIKKKRTII